MFSKFLYLLKELHKTSFRIFLQIRITENGAKFNSHDSGGHF